MPITRKVNPARRRFSDVILATMICTLLALCLAGCELDCAEVSAFQYDYGNSSGPCTNATLRVDEDGTVSYEYNMLNHLGEITGEECADQASLETTLSAGNARELIDTVCRAFSEGSEPSGGCEGAWGTIVFYDGEEVLEEGETGCRDGWSEGAAAISELTTSLR